MPYEGNSSGGSLGLDFRKWWRHMQPKSELLNMEKMGPEKKSSKERIPI